MTAGEAPRRTRQGSGPVSCSYCGATADAAPLGWLFETDAHRGDRYVCEQCTRTNVRAIEAKLDKEWW